MTNSLLVLKYGGSSLAQPEQIKSIAKQIRALRVLGHQLIIVVSAMGKTTDSLLQLAYSIARAPNRRELDMLLSTGERVSMSLMSMALNAEGCPAISFTGSQAGVLTDESHSNARIFDMKPIRIEAELAKGHIVVLAGFQGVSPTSKEITTLGRGGSDTTAVAMAAHFQAVRCEIRKDVDGVHSADPNLVASAQHIPHLHYQQLLEMTFWGAKVLHYRSVELATLLRLPLVVALAHGEGRSTNINEEGPMYENARILSVNSHPHVRALTLKCSNADQAFVKLQQLLNLVELPWPHVLDLSLTSSDVWTFLVTAPEETLRAVLQLEKPGSEISFDHEELATVSATCQGQYATDLPEKIVGVLAKKNIAVRKVIFSAMTVTVVVSKNEMERSVQALHSMISQ